MGNIVYIPQTTNIKGIKRPRNPTLGYIAKSAIYILKKYLHSHIHCSIVYSS